MSSGIRWILTASALVVAMALVTGLRASDELYTPDDDDSYEILGGEEEAVGLGGIKFRGNPNHDWQMVDPSETLYVSMWDSLYLKAVPDPAGSQWPANEPITWGGEAEGEGETTVIQILDKSQHLTDYKSFSCSFKEDTINVSMIVFDFWVEEVPEGGLCCTMALYDNIKLKGVVCPEIEYSFTCSEGLGWPDPGEPFVDIENENQHTVKITGIHPAEGYVYLNFFPAGQGVDVEWPIWDLWVYGMDRLVLPANGGGWEEIPDPFIVPLGATVTFQALNIPGNTFWPQELDKPVWGGEAEGEPINDTASVTFDEVSAHNEDYKIVTAECGNMADAKALVVDMILQYRLDETDDFVDVPETLYVAKGTEVEFKAVFNPDDVDMPEEEIVWSGETTGDGDTVKVSFNSVSSYPDNYKKVIAQYDGWSEEADVLVMDFDINNETPWLVIEDENGPGAGIDCQGDDSLCQKAENTATISYCITPQQSYNTLVPEITEVSLILYNNEHSFEFELDLEEYTSANIETKNGRLRAINGEWIPGPETFFPQGVYELKAQVEINGGEFDLLFELEEDEITIKPLMIDLTLTPDISAGESVCPYSDVFHIITNNVIHVGFGLAFEYDLEDDVFPLEIIFKGEALMGGEYSMQVYPIHRSKDFEYEGARGKWEGYGFEHHFSEIYKNYPGLIDEAPVSVVGEGDDYVLKIEMARQEDYQQTQSFTIPFSVEYRYDDEFYYPTYKEENF